MTSCLVISDGYEAKDTSGHFGRDGATSVKTDTVKKWRCCQSLLPYMCTKDSNLVVYRRQQSTLQVMYQSGATEKTRIILILLQYLGLL
ncbi:unnamed protein product [Calypogeia fissa]